MQTKFSLMGIEVSGAPSLFIALDVDKSHGIEREEFVVGCMKLKSGSSSVTVKCPPLETKEMLKIFLKNLKVTGPCSVFRVFVSEDSRNDVGCRSSPLVLPIEPLISCTWQFSV